MERDQYQYDKPHVEVCPGCGEETLEIDPGAPEGQECFCPACDWPFQD